VAEFGSGDGAEFVESDIRGDHGHSGVGAAEALVDPSLSYSEFGETAETVKGQAVEDSVAIGGEPRRLGHGVS
jgi:hypothetical protein